MMTHEPNVIRPKPITASLAEGGKLVSKGKSLPKTPGKTVKKPVCVVLVDGQEIIRIGLRALFSREADIEVVGEANSAATALQEVERLKPDVVILELRLANSSGLDACREIHRLKQGARVLFYSASDDGKSIFKAINAGANGFIHKGSATAELVKALRKVASGKFIMDEEVAQNILKRQISETEVHPSIILERLSPQEKRVVALVAQGKTNKEIGAEMVLHATTVKNYLGNAMEKIQMKRRSEVAAYIVKYGGD
jgi:DNA-binding NarL/FixJ family response regulator